MQTEALSDASHAVTNSISTAKNPLGNATIAAFLKIDAADFGLERLGQDLLAQQRLVCSETEALFRVPGKRAAAAVLQRGRAGAAGQATFVVFVDASGGRLAKEEGRETLFLSLSHSRFPKKKNKKNFAETS